MLQAVLPSSAILYGADEEAEEAGIADMDKCYPGIINSGRRVGTESVEFGGRRARELGG